MLVGLSALFGAGLTALLYDNPDWGSAMFLGCVLGVGFLLVRNALDFHDVYIENEATFVLKHLLYTNRLAARDVSGVRAGVLPGSYYLVTNRRNYYFYVIDLQDVMRELTSVQTATTLQALNWKVRQMQQKTA